MSSTSTVFRAEVIAKHRVSPTMLCVTFGGQGLFGFASGGFDQRIKLLFPLPGQSAPHLPPSADWYQQYLHMPEATRPPMRTYTARRHRPEMGEVDVEFAVHGDEGPGSRWALQARPGDVVGLVGPDARSPSTSGVLYRPQRPGWQLIVGDETALPAITSIVESLPRESLAQVVIEVPAPEDTRVLDTHADVTWLVRSRGTGGIVESVRRMTFPAGEPYVWAAGPVETIHLLRRHLVDERGWHPHCGHFGGYWRPGFSKPQRKAAKEPL